MNHLLLVWSPTFMLWSARLLVTMLGDPVPPIRLIHIYLPRQGISIIQKKGWGLERGGQSHTAGSYSELMLNPGPLHRLHNKDWYCQPSPRVLWEGGGSQRRLLTQEAKDVDMLRGKQTWASAPASHSASQSLGFYF